MDEDFGEISIAIVHGHLYTNPRPRKLGGTRRSRSRELARKRFDDFKFTDEFRRLPDNDRDFPFVRAPRRGQEVC